MTQPSYTPPSYIEVPDENNPPPGAVPLRAADLLAMGRAINDALTAAFAAQAAVSEARLREFIEDTVAAMVQNATYDDSTGKLVIGGGSTVITPPVNTSPVPEVYVETYNANAGTGADDTTALNAAFAAASGKVVKLGAGKTYRHTGLLNITAANVIVDGGGTARILATNQATSSLKITGDNCLLRDLVVECTSTARFDPYPYQLLLIDGGDGFKAVNVISRKSAATGMFITRTNGFTLENCVVEDSRADGFHITGGSSNGTSTNCKAVRPGDDGHAVVSYVGGSDGGMCHDIVFDTPQVIDQSVRGRGCTVVGGENVTYRMVNIDGTWGPGIYVACEPYGNNPTNGVKNVKFLGGTIRNAHSTTAIKNGSILVASSRSGVAIADVTIQDITTYNTRGDLPFEFGAYTEGGGLMSNVRFEGLKANNGSTGQLLYTNQVAPAFTQSDVTKAAGGAAAAVPTTVRITSTTPATTSATVAWAPTQTGTDGVTLSGVTTTINGGSPVAGPATGSRTFTDLAAGTTYTVAIQPLNGGVAYGSPVTTSVTIPTSTTAATVITSDSFTGSGEVIGRSTDIGLGGSPATWAGEPTGGFAVSGGQLVRGANLINSVTAVPTGTMNASVKVTIPALPTGDGIFIDLHRQASTITGTPNTYRAQIIVTGVLRVFARINGAETDLGAAGTIGTLAPGDELEFRYSQGRVELVRNGDVALSKADTSITTPGFAAIAAPSTTTGLAIKKFVVATAPQPAGQ